MKNNQDFNFRDLLEEKGFIPSGKSRSDGEKPASFGNLFKTLLQELATDPELNKKNEDTDINNRKEIIPDSPQATPGRHNTQNLENQRKKSSAEARRHEQGIRIRNEEIKKREEAEQRRAAKIAENQRRLEKEEEALAARLQHNLTIAAILKQPTTLKQAFILSEIITKPLGLR